MVHPEPFRLRQLNCRRNCSQTSAAYDPSVKEDVLEQIVDDYLQLQGYFTTHNLRFRPTPDQEGYSSKDDSVNSDVDVVGYHPTRTGHERVVVVSCKA